MEEMIFNLDEIKDIAWMGIRRAFIFTGLAVNASLNENFNDFHIKLPPGAIYNRLVSSEVTNEEMAEHKKNFSQWAISNGFRELIETFAVYLDHLYGAAFFCTGEGMPIEKLDKALAKFENFSLEKKIDSLKEHFTIQTDHKDILLSINKARNCLTHRLGKVSHYDCKKGGVLTIKWFGADLVFVQDGVEYPMEKAAILREGTSINLKTGIKIKTIPIGNILTFEPKELQEIAQTISIITEQFHQSAIDYFKSKGTFRATTSLNS